LPGFKCRVTGRCPSTDHLQNTKRWILQLYHQEEEDAFPT
jgi:hypothetical protein